MHSVDGALGSNDDEGHVNYNSVGTRGRPIPLYF